ncbi:HAD family phosphatase [Enterococcus sp. BWB1-3]|uniref:Cof-type HAD-IIB family hydrolase n=1 Tax=unclassified Enterococcus TaxID=2608891 RepID=UPI001920BBD6|nr:MULTISPECIES: Cof-type HAD-IIB family hydrolase [unclassified Enterococcus]MBL1229418.1 HAD family phosphatase [Enterococcus sp. BWB1-3]MCB5952589.1 Cof-type HAD-IIB family hydrolase [Enterococcus sp. BWT-B8]MCB5956451.1 Cof-type HAD-IIB family hydrolase [Enterococcus sp. CWB-B31]
MKKLIAIDLDGTTLNAQSLISNKTEHILKKAIAQGHYVSIATGRPYRLSHQFYQQLNLDTPMVNFNGGLVHIPDKVWDRERASSVHRDIVFDILSQKSALNLDFVAAENKETFFIDSFDYFDSAFFAAEPNEKNLLTVQNMTTNPTSLMICPAKDRVDQVSEVLTKEYGKILDIRTWGGAMPILEIVAKGIQKAKGVAEVADFLSIQQKDVIAFGDEHNDEEMIEYAGWGVAMNNAADRIKEVSNDITDKTNDEDGLADYLEKYLNLN